MEAHQAGVDITMSLIKKLCSFKAESKQVNFLTRLKIEGKNLDKKKIAEIMKELNPEENDKLGSKEVKGKMNSFCFLFSFLARTFFVSGFTKFKFRTKKLQKNKNEQSTPGLVGQFN